MKKRALPLLLALFLLLPGCGGKKVTYEQGGNGSQGSVIVKGYDAQYLEYTPDSAAGGFLYMANPAFLGDAFRDVTIEGDAAIRDGAITVGFTRGDDPDAGTVTGPGIRFTVELESETVTDSSSTPWEGKELTLTEAEMLHIAATLGEIIQGAEQYAQNVKEK